MLTKRLRTTQYLVRRIFRRSTSSVHKFSNCRPSIWARVSSSFAPNNLTRFWLVTKRDHSQLYFRGRQGQHHCTKLAISGHVETW